MKENIKNDNKSISNIFIDGRTIFFCAFEQKKRTQNILLKIEI